MLNTLFQIFICLGILIAYVTSYLLLGVNQYDWRIMLGLGMIPAIALLFIASCFMWESAVWFQRQEEAQRLLNPDDEVSKGEILDLFTGSNRKTVLTGFLLSAVQQLTGINAIIFYAPLIFGSVLVFHSSKASLLATIIVGAWNCLTSLVAVLFVDRVGRRPLFLGAVLCMCFSTILLGFNYYFFDGSEWSGYVDLGLILLFIGAFEIGPGPLFWVIVTEMFPDYVRDLGTSFINMLQWAFTLMISLTFPLMMKYIGLAVTYWIFSVIGVLCLVLLFILMPETKGRTIGEVRDEDT
jgi:sugar porter (SP) family MFS transporter